MDYCNLPFAAIIQSLKCQSIIMTVTIWCQGLYPGFDIPLSRYDTCLEGWLLVFFWVFQFLTILCVCIEWIYSYRMNCIAREQKLHSWCPTCMNVCVNVCYMFLHVSVWRVKVILFHINYTDISTLVKCAFPLMLVYHFFICWCLM